MTAKSSARATRVHALLDAELFDAALAGSGPAHADPTRQEAPPTGQKSGPLNQDASELRISPNALAAGLTPDTLPETQVKLHSENSEAVSVRSRRKASPTAGRRQTPAPHPFTPDPSAMEAGAPDIPASSSRIPHSDVGESPLPDPPAAPPEPPARVLKTRPELGEHRQYRDSRDPKPASLDRRGAGLAFPSPPLTTFATSEKPGIGAHLARGRGGPRKRAGVSLERPGRLPLRGASAFKSPRPANGAAPAGDDRSCTSPPTGGRRVIKAAPVSKGRPGFFAVGSARVQRSAPQDGPSIGSAAPGLGDEVEFLKNGEVRSASRHRNDRGGS